MIIAHFIIIGIKKKQNQNKYKKSSFYKRLKIATKISMLAQAITVLTQVEKEQTRNNGSEIKTKTKYKYKIKL